MKRIYHFLMTSLCLMAMDFVGTACSESDDVTSAKYPAPVITEITPSEGLPSSVVTIKGSEFGSERAERIGRVYFGGVEATDYVSWTANEIKVRVPAKGQTGNITLWVHKNSVTSEGEFTCVPGAEILELSPATTFPGSTITLTGKNFAYFLQKGITAADVEVVFQAEEGTTSAKAATFDEETITVEVPMDARGGAVKVKLGELQTIDGPDLVLVGDLKINLLDFVAIYDAHNKKDTNENEMVKETVIENTKNGSYVIYEIVAPATGLFEPYLLAGTAKDESFLNVDMGNDLIELKNKTVDVTLTQDFIKGAWGDKNKYTFGPFLLREGKTYYLKVTFLQSGTTWVGNVHEIGMSLAANQDQPGAIVVDNTEALGYRLWENDFNSKFKTPFYDGWAEAPNYIKVENGYCEFYFNQAALDANPDRRMLKGCELTCGYKTTTAGWYGFRIFLPSKEAFPDNIGESIIAQLFNQGDKNCWAGHLSINNDKLVLSHRYALIDPTVGFVGNCEWGKWMSVVIYFKVGRNNKGRLKAWFGDDMQESKPVYDSGDCNFGFGNWIDDDTLDGEVSDENPVADAIGAKFGLYVATGGDRIIRFDDVKLLEGNPKGAFDIVRPK